MYMIVPVTYFHILSTPSWDALTMNWCLCGTMARSVTKSTWEWLWVESVYISVPLGAEVDDAEAGEVAELADWGAGVHISLNTSTPSMIFDLKGWIGRQRQKSVWEFWLDSTFIRRHKGILYECERGVGWKREGVRERKRERERERSKRRGILA